jgi:hypothetical protein
VELAFAYQRRLGLRFEDAPDLLSEGRARFFSTMEG